MDIKDCKSELDKYVEAFKRGDYSQLENFLNSVQIGIGAQVLSDTDVEECFWTAGEAINQGYQRISKSSRLELDQKVDHAFAEHERVSKAAESAYASNIMHLFMAYSQIRKLTEKS